MHRKIICNVSKFYMVLRISQARVSRSRPKIGHCSLGCFGDFNAEQWPSPMRIDSHFPCLMQHSASTFIWSPRNAEPWLSIFIWPFHNAEPWPSPVRIDSHFSCFAQHSASTCRAKPQMSPMPLPLSTASFGNLYQLSYVGLAGPTHGRDRCELFLGSPASPSDSEVTR